MPDIFEEYEPKHPDWQEVWRQLSTVAQRRRWKEAIRRQRIVVRVATSISKGESERRALRHLPAVDRSNFRRWKSRYTKFGLDGLFDWRLPPRAEELPAEARAAICTLRRSNPDIEVGVLVEHVLKHHGFSTSATTVKRVLRQEGLNRRRGPVIVNPLAGEQRLELGGMKLVEAACVETGYVGALAIGIMDELTDASSQIKASSPADTSNRDEWGRFLPDYNERLRKGPGEELGPGFASIEVKRAGLAPERLHVNDVGGSIIERKLYALLVSPLLGSGRWDGIRVPRGALLGELCGYPYMPATLDLFTRELKYVGVASTLWEIHARLWLHQTRGWGGGERATVLFIDSTNKPLWTDFFSQSAFVDLRGRVMPALELVSFHSGYGVPLWMMTESGHAPLVKVVPGLLEQLRGALGTDVGRIVVIDAEANSIPFLKGLEQAPTPRAWVTRLRPQWLEGKTIFNRTNYRTYRDGDRVRMGLCDFNDPEIKGATFRARVVEIERRSKGTITYLGASTLLDEREWKAADVANLYFERWPKQEAKFRAINQAVGFKDVHGYGKQLVDNISVVTELDKIDQRIRNLESSIERNTIEQARRAEELNEQQKLLRRQERRLETVTHHLDKRMTGGQRITPKLRRVAKEQRTLVASIRKESALEVRKGKTLERLGAQRARQEAELAEREDEKQRLESHRKIYKHDTELDSLFSLLKVGLVLLVTYVLKEYLGDASMDPVTFLERIATLPARIRTTPELELVTFLYNRRDPDVMKLLASNCNAINARGLRTRSGRLLRLQVEPAPQPRLPPPKRRRVNTKGRFSRRSAE